MKPSRNPPHPPPEEDSPMALSPGARALEFSLQATPDQAVSLRDFRGKLLFLFFCPADWSPVCGDQVVIYNELLDEFRRLGAAVCGISVPALTSTVGPTRASPWSSTATTSVRTAERPTRS